jgi:hypothetical protein
MGYSIEVSFNILKHGSVTETNDFIMNLATSYGCISCYIDYEFETNVQYKRSHSILTVNFENSNIYNLVGFLKKIKMTQGLFVETIYDDNSNMILYASKYYVTQKMDKFIAKEYTKNKRKRSYSEDDTMILNTVEKIKI